MKFYLLLTLISIVKSQYTIKDISTMNHTEKEEGFKWTASGVKGFLIGFDRGFYK